MAKKISEKSKKKPFLSSRFYLIGSIILFLVIAISVKDNSMSPLAKKAHDYIKNKQELHEILGSINEIIGLPTKETEQNQEENQEENLSITLKGSLNTGVLEAKAKRVQDEWALSNLSLKVNNQRRDLSPFYISQMSFHAASASSKPQTKPNFNAGQDIFVKTKLVGINKNKPPHIQQSLEIYDYKNRLITSKKNIANTSNGLLTTRIGNLPPGKYILHMIFEDAKTKHTEIHREMISIRQMKQNLTVKTVEYFADKTKETPQKATSFKTDQDIFLRMHLDGFMVNNDTVAGAVDLKVKNSQGAVVAYKPRFVEFNKKESKMPLVIDGQIKLPEPDVYFLSFRVRDQFAKTNVVHDEKVVVQINDKQ
ncbi:MAG: cytochrome c oxidase assembly factor Coa1 family protein [bacterium]|nr:hypothetical protein [bacterium]MBU1917990.1 hypothetical protein [bacterium]